MKLEFNRTMIVRNHVEWQNLRIGAVFAEAFCTYPFVQLESSRLVLTLRVTVPLGTSITHVTKVGSLPVHERP